MLITDYIQKIMQMQKIFLKIFEIKIHYFHKRLIYDVKYAGTYKASWPKYDLLFICSYTEL